MPVPLSSEFNADVVEALPGPAWLLDLRRSSWELFAGLELPTESEEIWRYSRIEELDLARYAPCPSATVVGTDELPVAVQQLVAAVGPAATLVISHNGGEGPVLRPQPGLEVMSSGHGPLREGGEPLTARVRAKSGRMEGHERCFRQGPMASDR